MLIRRLMGFCSVILLAGGVAYGQRPAPIADPVEQVLLPSGISRLPVKLNCKLAYIFKDEAGVEALHLIGDFVVTVGGALGERLSSQEAVVWITPREYKGHRYHHLEILLWRDAEIIEMGGTVTSGPALFVTLNTYGTVAAEVDDVAFRSFSDSRAYAEGNAIRQQISKVASVESDERAHLLVIDATGLTSLGKKKKPRPLIHVGSEGELTFTQAKDGRQVLTVTGGVYLSRGIPGDKEHLEIRADSVVVFMPASASSPESAGLKAVGLGGEVQPPSHPSPAGTRREARESSDRQLLSAGFGEVEVESAYLEGDVIMTQGPHMIRASRLYYNFLRDRALILDAVVRTSIQRRNIPLYMRAAEIRQLSRNHYTAADALLTTSEFHTPHYHVGASHVELIDRTPPDVSGQRQGMRAGTFTVRGATLNVGGRPIAYWPYIRGSIDTSETAIKSIRGGFSGDFGVEVETDWHLFNVLGLETPDGFEATLSLDYFTRRGPAAGVEAIYETGTYSGLLRSYLLADNETDFLGREREKQSEKDIRGRLLLRHRQYLQDDWQLSLELSYISDRGFLEEFFESEFDNDKEQETLLYLKKQWENRAFTALLQGRILDFAAQTERLPDLGFRIIGEPVETGPIEATWFSESRLGIVRQRPGRQTFRELLRDGRTTASGSVGRADSRQEINTVVDLGPLRVVPFVSARATGWDDSAGGGGVARIFATYGLRASMYLSRIYPDAKSSLLDIDGLRHVVKPDIVAWVSHTNRDSSELFPFDQGVEGIDEVDGVALGIRQRWQTKRGPPKTRRTVDLLTLDVEMGLLNDAESDETTNGYVSFSRPENSISQNYLNTAAIWRVNDRTALVSEMNYDLNDGEVDILNVSVAVERSPRLSYLVGYRLIEESDSELLGFDLNYRLTEKHTLALRELYDLERGRTLDFTVALIRRFPRWFGAVSFAFDEPEDDFGISVSIWPEGLPQAALGSRRFTGLSAGTRLRSE